MKLIWTCKLEMLFFLSTRTLEKKQEEISRSITESINAKALAYLSCNANLRMFSNFSQKYQTIWFLHFRGSPGFLCLKCINLSVWDVFALT